MNEYIYKSFSDKFESYKQMAHIVSVSSCNTNGHTRINSIDSN